MYEKFVLFSGQDGMVSKVLDSGIIENGVGEFSQLELTGHIE